MGKSSGGGGTNSTVTQTSQPPQAFLDAYTNLLGQAQGVTGQQPQAYQGPLVAGFTPQQQQAFSTVENSQGLALPYINSASQMLGQAATPFYNTVQNYISPYTQNVTDSLQGLFNQQNAQQLQQVRGNAVSQGAYGGDREAVAEALTAQQQQLSEAPTLANVLQGGYQTGLGAAESQGWLGSQAGLGLGQLGGEAQQSALQGASSLLQAGGLQQQLAQEQMNIPYQEFVQAQAAPYQNLNTLAGISEGLGGVSGGSSSTQYPGPSLISQLGGLGVSGLGLLGSTGAFGSSGYLTGANGLFSGLFGGGAAAGIGDAAATGAGLGAASGVGTGIGDAIASALPFALAPIGAADGGRTGLADGGMVEGNLTLPPVPTLNLDYIAPANPTVKGKGPPAPPPVPAGAANQGFGLQQGMDFLQGLQKVKGLFGDSGDPKQGLQSGGTAETPQAGLAIGQLGGMGPNVQGYIQRLQQLPMDQLQNMAARVPAGSSYGQIIQRVLSQRHMMPSAGTSQVSSAAGVPIGTGAAQVGQPGAQQPGAQQPGAQQPGAQQPGQPMGGMPPQLGMAAGGAAESTAEPTPAPIPETPDMDPQPIVDHTGETVVIRYPSEGKSLDLGIPSSPSMRGKRASGGSAGASPVTGTGGASPFVSALPTGSGIAVPQVSLDLVRDPTGAGGLGIQNTAVAPGGGLGTRGDPNAWFSPLPQYQPPGTGFNSQGQLFFPQVGLNSPGMIPLQGGSSSGGSGSSSSSSTDTSSATGMTSADQAAQQQMLLDQSVALQNSSGGGKRGGRTGLQGGGDVDDEGVAASAAAIPAADDVDLIEPRGATGDTGDRGSGLGNAIGVGLASGIGGAGLAAPGIGEPAAPQAQITPDRAPVASLPRVKAEPLANEAVPAKKPVSGAGPTDEQLADSDRYAAALAGGYKGTIEDFKRGTPSAGAPDTGLITERTNPDLAARINAAPAAGEPIPLDNLDRGASVPESTPPASGGSAQLASGEPAPVMRSTIGPVTSALAKEAGYASDPDGYAALANYLTRGEASGFNVLYGNKQFQGYEKHPADLGWQGGRGPDGRPTHAAGLFQFEPATWHDEQQKLGLTDFSPLSQTKAGLDLATTNYRNATGRDLLADFKAARFGEIDSALHSTWTSLGSGAVAGAPSAGGPDQVVGQGQRGLPIEQAAYAGQQPSGGISANSPGYNEAITKILADIEQHTKSGHSLYNSPWYPVLAAGLGMLASRSPFPGVALGEGGLQGLKALQEQQVNAPKAQLEQVQADMARLNLALLPEKMRLAAEMGQPPAAGMTGTAAAGAGATPIPPAAAAAAMQPLPTAPAAAAASVAAGAPAVSPTTGLPVPTGYGQSPANSINSRYDQAIAQVDQQIAQTQHDATVAQRLGILSGDPGKAAEHNAAFQANIARLMAQRVQLLNNYPPAAGARAAAEAAAKLPYEVHMGRPGSIAFQGTQPVGAVPELRKFEPATGAPYYQWVAPPLGGQGVGGAGPTAPAATEASPTGIPATAAGPAGVNPMYMHAVNEQIASDRNTLDKALQPAAEKANDTMLTAREILNLAQTVPTGLGSQWKLQAGRVLSALGVPDASIAGMNTAQGQEAQKLFLTLSAQAVRNMGAREPGSVISLFANAYPNLATEPGAVKLMTNILYMQGKRTQDLYQIAEHQHAQAVQDLQMGKPYQPLGPMISDLNKGTYSSENYLRAGLAMAGERSAWQGLQNQQQLKSVRSLVPDGVGYMLPNGQMMQKQQ